MKFQELHSWQLSPAQAQKLQLDLASRISKNNEVNKPRYVAGVDISKPNSAGIGYAAAVVLSYPELQLVEVAIAKGKLSFPYIPGLLSFREAPLILAACQKLSQNPDLLLVDGQGIAHPRRLGIASHLGLILDVPTIGCAKSRLCGQHQLPASKAGSYADLIDKDETIGAVLRTKTDVSPVYISIGHKVDLPSAVYWALHCCRSHRLPEPCRLAHIAAGGNPITTIKALEAVEPRLFT
ncbi:MAG: deoxyribonuclease V [Chloroflexi bacterium]|nr:deoxyribonuclease V [Chloroflexota bacterium]MBM3173034.1 deoxyribonuclease V [Chloroflexota bacterium]MBM3174178.1 deoxyribonuclease V [Chloroflexota bacterium]MBM4449246.1 deoxyribonuclease V [Chloroflexota bacterium]